MASGMKLSPKKQRALEALLIHPRVADAASAAGIAPHVLRRWMKEPEFSEALRKRDRAEQRQCRRWLGQGFFGAVNSTALMMYRGKTPAMRLKAARDLIRLADAGIEFNDFAAAAAEAERLVRDRDPAARGGGRLRGHGAKLPRRGEKAITALLSERSIAAAARAAGVSTPALCRWFEQPSFTARCTEAAAVVFGEGIRLAQKCRSDAATIIRSFSGDPAIPEATRLEANRYIIRETMAQNIEDLNTRIAETEALAGGGEPQEKWKAFGKDLCRRLKRIKAAAASANWAGDTGFDDVHAEDGRAVGISTIGRDGKRVWVQPPPGSRKGDPVPDEEAAA